ncbi:FAD binding domain protein, partial [Onchocerca flexuosa]
AGIIGQDLEKQLNEKGYTCGHEPDSIEFSSLGGWISTRASGQTLPYLMKFMEKNLGVNIEIQTPSIRYEDLIIPIPFDNQDFINFLLSNNISFSNKSNYRLVRSHGHTVHDIANLRNGTVGRIPDIIVWPKSEEEVVTIVDAAQKFNVVIIPIGGGTSVTGALECPSEEARSICSLDLTLMNAIIYIDDRNLLCRAQVPRLSSGPDLQQIILGSEGILGVVTEATVKIFPKPEVKKYDSFVFPTFEHGVNFFREIAKQHCQCASLRLVDNQQFLMGQAMKTYNGSLLKSLKHALEGLYITKWKNFKVKTL